MFIFYGWGKDSKQFDLFSEGVCPNCGMKVSSRVVMTYSYVSLFFIPIIKWNKQYFLQCSNCGYLIPISKEDYLNIKNGVAPKQDDALPVADAAGDPFENGFAAESAPDETAVTQEAQTTEDTSANQE